MTRLSTSNQREQQTDSIIIRQTLRDTTIVVRQDSSMIQALIECDSLGRARIKEIQQYQAGEHLKPPTVIIRDNILTSSAYSDSLELKIQWLERTLEYYKKQKQTITNTEYVEVNRLTWWQTLWVWIGRVSTALVVCLTVYKITKNYERN